LIQSFGDRHTERPHRGEYAIRINDQAQILNERRAITADTALRIARLLGSTPEYRLRLQARYDPQTQAKLTGTQIQKRVRPIKAA
jgi:antitoxin HigA-1